MSSRLQLAGLLPTCLFEKIHQNYVTFLHEILEYYTILAQLNTDYILSIETALEIQAE